MSIDTLPSEQLECRPVPDAPDAARESAGARALSAWPRVGDARSWATVASVWSRVLWLAWRAHRNPLHCARAIHRLRAARGRPPHWAGAKLAFSSGRTFWDLHTPGWPSVAFDRYVERELDRLGAAPGGPAGLQTVIVAMTRRCALRCEHCFEWNALRRDEALSADALREIMRRLQERGVAQIFLSGGEPLQRFDDLLALTESASAQSDVWILSSGVGLTPARAARLRAAGLTGVALSLDHWDASAHDRFRGVRGTFDAVAGAAANARAAGLLVALSLCPTRAFVSPENLERYAWTARDLGASFIQILEPRAVGRYAGLDVALDPAQRGELERFTARMNLDPGARALPAVTYMDWFARTHGCRGAADRYVYVDTEGAMHACPFCRGPGVRVLEHGLDEAIARLRAAGCPAGHDGISLNTTEHGFPSPA